MLSVVTVPMSCMFPFGSTAYNVTGTPLGVGGLLTVVAFCMCKYSIHSVIDSLATAGVFGWGGGMFITLLSMSARAPPHYAPWMSRTSCPHRPGRPDCQHPPTVR